MIIKIFRKMYRYSLSLKSEHYDLLTNMHVSPSLRWIMEIVAASLILGYCSFQICMDHCSQASIVPHGCLIGDSSQEPTLLTTDSQVVFFPFFPSLPPSFFIRALPKLVNGILLQKFSIENLFKKNHINPFFKKKQRILN